MNKVLIVDDDRATIAGMADVVEEWGYEPQIAYDIKGAWKIMNELLPDVALIDLRLPDGSGLELLRDAKERFPDLPVIILTGHASVDTAVDALKDGAEDYLTKPVDLSRLEVMLRGIEAKEEMREEILELRRQLQKMGTLGHMVGKSPAMQRLFQEIEMVANTDANVFIVGESGSGKEVVSSTIHTLSKRKNKPFIAFNCGAISPTLIESEIFGHEKGAFTNAIKRRLGYFETAKGGTVFLDEITEMPLDLQVKLLRVLEEGKFRRVGGNDEIPIDARIIAASNRDPMKAIEDGRLREDLYYRLNVFPIDVPPLRERKEDIPMFVAYFLENLNESEEKTVEKVSPEFIEALERYDWPGNVRELRNVVNRAFIMAREEALEVNTLPPKLITGEMRRQRKTSMEVPVDRSLAEIEKMIITESLAIHGDDVAAVAEALGITEKQVRSKADLDEEKRPATKMTRAGAKKTSKKKARSGKKSTKKSPASSRKKSSKESSSKKKKKASTKSTKSSKSKAKTSRKKK